MYVSISFGKVALLYFPGDGQKFKFLFSRLNSGEVNYLLERFTTFPDGSVENFGCPITLQKLFNVFMVLWIRDMMSFIDMLVRA